MDIGDEVLDYSESEEEGTGKEEVAHVRHVDSKDESTPFEGIVSPVPVARGYAPPNAKEEDVDSDEQELDFEEEMAQDGEDPMVASQSAKDYPFLSSDDEEDASAIAQEESHKSSHIGEEDGSVHPEGEEEGTEVEGEDEVTQVVGEDEGSEVEGEEEGSQVEGEKEGTEAEREDEGTQVEAEDEGTEAEGGDEGAQVEAEDEGTEAEGGDEGAQVEAEDEGTEAEGGDEGAQVEAEDEGTEAEEGDEGTQVEAEDEGTEAEEGDEGTQVEAEDEGTEAEEGDEGAQVEGDYEGGQVEKETVKSELDVGREDVEQEQEADVSDSSLPPDQRSADLALQHLSAEGGTGGPSELFGSSDEEDASTSKPKRQRLESDSDLEAEATGEFGAQGMPEMKEADVQGLPEMEEVGTQEVVEGDEEYVGSVSEEEEGGGIDEELAAELDDLTEGEGQVLEKVVEEEEEEDDQLPESSEGRPQVYDFDIMMEKRRAQQRRSRKRKRDINDLTADDDIVDDLIGKMRHAAEEDRKLNLAQRAATKKLALLPVVVESLKKSDVVMRFIDAGGLEVMTDWLTPLPDHSLPNQKIRDTLLENLRNFPAVDNYTLKKSRIGKAVMLLYRHPKETRKNKEKAGKLIQDWARPIFGLTSDLKSLSRDEREQRDYAHLTPSVRRRLSSSEEGQRKTGMEIDDALKPGDHGWIGRARVPVPSNKDYVVRPKWNVETEYKKSRKKTMTRYDKQVQKWRDTKKSKGATHAAKLSIAGNKMAI